MNKKKHKNIIFTNNVSEYIIVNLYKTLLRFCRYPCYYT